MSARASLGPPRASGVPEGRLVFGALLLALSSGCGGLTTYDGAQNNTNGGDVGDGSNDGATGDAFEDPSRNDDDDDEPGSSGGTGDAQRCSCAAEPAVLVLETAGGSYEFSQPPVPLLYPAFDFGCAPPGPAYVPAACERRASIAACDDEFGCLILAPATDDAQPQLTWYDSAGTSVTQVRGGESEVVIEVSNSGPVTGYFAFSDDGVVSHSGRFSVCSVTVERCD